VVFLPSHFPLPTLPLLDCRWVGWGAAVWQSVREERRKWACELTPLSINLLTGGCLIRNIGMSVYESCVGGKREEGRYYLSVLSIHLRIYTFW